MGYRDFIIFMASFVAGAAVIAGLIYLLVRLVRKSRESAERNEYIRFNRELDAKLEKRGFTRTLVLNDNLAFDEERGLFYCSFPYGRGVVDTILPVSAITEYKIEPAAAFTSGYLFTFAFIDSEPPRKVSRQAHVINDEINARLIAVLEKYGAGNAGE